MLLAEAQQGQERQRAAAAQAAIQVHLEAVQARAGQLQQLLELLVLEVAALKQGSKGSPVGPHQQSSSHGAPAAGGGGGGSVVDGVRGAGRMAMFSMGSPLGESYSTAGWHGAPAAGGGGGLGLVGITGSMAGETYAGGLDAGAGRTSMATLFSDGTSSNTGGTGAVIGAGGGGGGPAGVRWVHRYQQQGAWCHAEAMFGMFNSEGVESDMGE